MNEVGVQVLDRGGPFHARDSVDEIFEHDDEFDARKCVAEAEVRPAATERHVLVRHARGVHRVRVRKDLFVVVARGKPHDDLVALGDVLPTELDVLRRGATEVVHRARHAKELFDRPRDVLRVFLQVRNDLRVFDEVVHGVSDCLASRLVTGHDEQQEVGVEVALAEFDSIHRSLVHHHRHQVGSVLAETLTAKFITIGENLERSGGPERHESVRFAFRVGQQKRRQFGVGVSEHLVSPADDVVDVAVRHIEKSREDANREVGRDVLQEVELPFGKRLVERRRGEPAKERFVLGDVLRGELSLE